METLSQLREKIGININDELKVFDLMNALKADIGFDEMKQTVNYTNEWSLSTQQREDGKFLNYWFIWEGELNQDTIIDIEEN